MLTCATQVDMDRCGLTWVDGLITDQRGSMRQSRIFVGRSRTDTSSIADRRWLMWIDTSIVDRCGLRRQLLIDVG